MKTITTTIAATLSAFSLSASAATLHLAIDVSGSNPLLSDASFGAVASAYVAEQIAQLKSGDKVHVQTFGARESAANMRAQTYVIGRRIRPEAVATVLTQFIRSLPGRQDLSQGATNILGWLELHSDFGCEEGSRIVMLTDGIESSSYVDARALLEGKAKLPEPDVALSGCTISFFGIGAGMPVHMAKNLRNAWSEWAAKAGAKFQAVIP